MTASSRLVWLCVGIIGGSLAAAPIAAQVAQRMFATTPTGLTTGVSTPITCTANGSGCALDVIVRPATDIEAGADDALGWATRSQMKSPSDGIITLLNDAGTNFTRLQFGGTTSAFPSLQRNGVQIQALLADGSGNASFATGPLTVNGTQSVSSNLFVTGQIGQGGFTTMRARSDGVVTISNAGETDFGRLQFGGTTNAFPALRRGGNSLQVRSADDSGWGGLGMGNLYLGHSTSLNTLTMVGPPPTISSGFGTSPSIVGGTTSSFRLNVGTGGTANGGVFSTGTTTTNNGWNCVIQTATPRANERTVQTASTTSSVTVQNQLVSTAAATPWAASEILIVVCLGY